MSGGVNLTIAGGLEGASTNATTSSSYATGAVSGNTNVGGLIGELSGGTLQSSYATGAVTGLSNDVGGLIGGIYNNYYGGAVNYLVPARSTTITSSHATGNVTGGNYVGGLIGYNSIIFGYFGLTISIDGSYATGDVKGSQYVGGFAGLFGSGTLNNIWATGAVTGTQYVGGLVGEVDGAGVSNAYATGAVSGNLDVGGLIGSATDLYVPFTLINSHAGGAVTGLDGARDIGGLIGLTTTFADNGSVPIRNVYATGSVTVGNDASAIGGLIGGNGGTNAAFGPGYGMRVDSSWASGAVKTGDGANAVGGLIGYAYDGGTNGVASVGESYATGAVMVGNYASMVGGLIGADELTGQFDQVSTLGVIHNVFATGSITAGSNAYLVGGLLGNINAPELDNIYATGSVTTGANSNGVGGLAGGFDNPGILNFYSYLYLSGFSTGRVTAGAGSTSVDASIGLNYRAAYDSSNNFILYNSDTAGVGSAVSQAETTAQFTDGSALAAFNGRPYFGGFSFAGGSNGLYPYAAFAYPNGVQQVSGTVGGAPTARSTVGLYVNGAAVTGNGLGPGSAGLASVGGGQLLLRATASRHTPRHEHDRGRDAERAGRRRARRLSLCGRLHGAGDRRRRGSEPGDRRDLRPDLGDDAD